MKRCNHCQLEFDESVMIKDGNLYFCCKGCQGVYHLLNQNNLDDFYNKLGNNKLESVKTFDDDLSRYDTEAFIESYTKKTDDGFLKIDLIIEGIHCAACVWLNEKVLYDKDGIVEANINFTNNKATIIFDIDTIKISEIIQTIRLIGYNAYPYSSSDAEDRAKKNLRDFVIRMGVAIFGTLNIMMLAVAKYAGFFSGIDSDIKNLVHFGEFILATPVLFYSGWIFFRGAFYGLKNKIVNMDLLVSVGSLLTYLYSIYVLISGVGESYFDSVSMIITFVLVGKYLEIKGKKNAIDIIDKIKVSFPKQATIIKGNEKVNVDIEDIKVGDIIELSPGDSAVVDGILLNYTSSFDESLITGESNPIIKNSGDFIYSGSINLDTNIRYSAIKTFKDSTINSIVSLIEDSINSKPKIEELANNISKYFSIIVLSLSIFSFILWYFYPLNTGFNIGNEGFERAFIIAISVIVIACPCALSLATPIASLVGISELSKRGILVKEAKFIEIIPKIKTLIIDKTGTITDGKMSVVKESILKDFDKDLLYSLVEASKHPISKGIKKYIKAKNLNLEVKTIAGKGLISTYNGYKLYGGSLDFIKEQGIEFSFNSNYSLFFFAIDKEVVAIYELEDKIKDGAKDTFDYIKSLGIDVIMLTGDTKERASYVAKAVGISFIANLDPFEKANYIKKLDNVAMVGDGINDSIALSSSSVSIAMASGADISLNVSDIIILNNKLVSLKELFRLSNRTFKFIKQNLFLSLIYNSITIPLAILGYVIPLFAALSMSISSLLVVSNSMRIKR